MSLMPALILKSVRVHWNFIESVMMRLSDSENDGLETKIDCFRLFLYLISHIKSGVGVS